VNLLDLAPADARGGAQAWAARATLPSYRADQVLARLWQRPVGAWRDATELPAGLRADLEEEFPIERPVRLAVERSRDGTVKFLWQFERQGLVEAVLIPEGRRRTLCISSQAGCAYGCVFCATGRMGFVRHLSPWEITAQVRELLLDPEFGKPTNIVFMGMGEPLHNWRAVDTALTILNDPMGFGIGARRITVSTVGVIPGLEALAARPEQFRVALSLHAPTSVQRAALMPVERKYPLARVVETLRRFPRRVTFEYVMIAGLNDTREDARALAGLARDLGAHVNLLPLHPGGAPQLGPTSTSGIEAFAAALTGAGVNVTVRESRGLDIRAACGQLRTEFGQGGVPTQDHAHVE
jgi:23S rRNA (adenine2503-C2)-methyltransferase